jgi:predicted outer membrane repeat protein
MYPMSRRRIHGFLAVALLLGLLLALPAAPARATGTNRFVVTAADGPVVQTGCTSYLDYCSLREALAAAADGDTIQFHPQVTGTITLDPAQGALRVNHSVTIQGPGAAVLAVDGGYNPATGHQGVPVFVAIIQLAINGITIQNGFNADTGTGAGGGGIAGSAIVDMTDCVVRGNHALNDGGGIHATGLTLTRSTVSDNSAGGIGGGIALVNGLFVVGAGVLTDSIVRRNVGGDGGGLYSFGNTTIATSTIADNTARGNGGGAIFDNSAARYTDITASTITGNTADGAGKLGGGILVPAFSPTPTVSGTIIAGNWAINGATMPDLSGAATSRGFNLIGDGTGASIRSAANAGTDQVGSAAAPLDARFDPRGVRDNGGPTPTVALLPNSPAIDASGGCPGGSTDQRGQPRVAACDIGAYEYQPVTPTVGDATAPASGGSITFHGTGFQTGTQLTIGGTAITAPADGVSSDGTTLTVAVPTHSAGGVNVAVANPGEGHVAAGTITYQPVVASVSPASGSATGGGSATITGIGFGTDPAPVNVKFGAASAAVKVVSDMQLVVTAPAGSGTVDVTVTVNGVSATKAGVYTYGTVVALPPPQPTAAPVTGGNPLPASRPAGSSVGGAPPAPLPVSRP